MLVGEILEFPENEKLWFCKLLLHWKANFHMCRN